MNKIIIPDSTNNNSTEHNMRDYNYKFHIRNILENFILNIYQT